MDHRVHLPMPEGNLDDYSLANGFSVKILEPLKRYRVDYNSGTGTEVHLVFDALMPWAGASLLRERRYPYFLGWLGLMCVYTSLTQWDYEGKVGYGDAQHAFPIFYIRRRKGLV